MVVLWKCSSCAIRFSVYCGWWSFLSEPGQGFHGNISLLLLVLLPVFSTFLKEGPSPQLSHSSLYQPREIAVSMSIVAAKNDISTSNPLVVNGSSCKLRRTVSWNQYHNVSIIKTKLQRTMSWYPSQNVKHTAQLPSGSVSAPSLATPPEVCASVLIRTRASSPRSPPLQPHVGCW